jgi:type III secretion protein U
MTQEAEEKHLPASDKKLRDSRRKGQVSQSRDLISGFTLFAALAYLFFIWPTVSERLSQLVQTVTASGGSFEEIAMRAVRHAIALLFLVTAPLVGIVVVFTLLFGVIATHGPIFSFEPIKPQFDHINPAKGLKKIFSLRNAIEFAKGLAKVVFLACLFVAILLAWLQPLFDAPGCGESCIEPMIKAVLTPLGIAAALGFILIGLIDVPLQRWLFLRDMRMTRTEFKREHKDLEGDPLIRQELQRQRRDAVARPIRLGLKNAVLVFVSGDRMVALRYVRDETPVPVIVAKGQGRSCDGMIAEARRLGIPIVEDASLVEPLFENTGVGAYIGQELFSPVVRHLVRFGLT